MRPAKRCRSQTGDGAIGSAKFSCESSCPVKRMTRGRGKQHRSAAAPSATPPRSRSRRLPKSPASGMPRQNQVTSIHRSALGQRQRVRQKIGKPATNMGIGHSASGAHMNAMRKFNVSVNLRQAACGRAVAGYDENGWRLQRERQSSPAKRSLRIEHIASQRQSRRQKAQARRTMDTIN